jgi:hypothetical protein
MIKYPGYVGALASGIHHKGIALLGCYAVLIGNWLATFWDSVSVPSSSVRSEERRVGKECKRLC